MQYRILSIINNLLNYYCFSILPASMLLLVTLLSIINDTFYHYCYLTLPAPMLLLLQIIVSGLWRYYCCALSAHQPHMCCSLLLPSIIDCQPRRYYCRTALPWGTSDRWLACVTAPQLLICNNCWKYSLYSIYNNILLVYKYNHIPYIIIRSSEFA